MSVNIDDIRNPFEVSIFKQIKAALRGTSVKDISYETERLKYITESFYIPDFVVRFKDGRVIFIETKGYLRPEDKKKMRLIKQQHPKLDIRIIFQKNNRFKGSQTTYSDWADKMGIPWAIGEVPKEWLK